MVFVSTASAAAQDTSSNRATVRAATRVNVRMLLSFMSITPEYISLFERIHTIRHQAMTDLKTPLNEL